MSENTPIFGLPYPDGGDGPDGPGAVAALALALELGPFKQEGWAPGLGGTGVLLGAGGGTNGFTARLGNLVFYVGRIAFGSGASFGSTNVTITGFNPFGNTNADLAVGVGFWDNGVGARYPLMLTPSTPSEFFAQVIASPLAAMSGIGTPAAGSTLRFVIAGVLV